MSLALMFKKWFSRTPVPRLYADFNTKAGATYWDYSNSSPQWADLSNYQFVEILGTGKFSTVSKVRSLSDNKLYTLKKLKPLKANSMLKYKREIKVLQNLKGGPNIPVLYDQAFYEEDGSVALVYEYTESDPLRMLSGVLNDFELRYYVYELLKALDYAHSHGIMHRDVKPGNICIDHKARQLRLIDWGLAEFYKPGTKSNLRVSTMNYKAPELLIQCPLYHYSIDSWSLGATLAGIVFKKDPFFYGRDLIEQLLLTTEFAGSEALLRYLKRHKIELPAEVRSLVTFESKKDLRMYLSRDSQELATSDALDLIEKLLVLDHTDRVLAKEAMEHAYFDPVREVMRKVSAGSLDVPKDSLETAQVLVRSLS
jgi:casein kinase II subunit alpha